MRDREILRSLAGQIAEIAARNGGQQETRELYRAVNDRRMIRPVVLIDELPWNQLDFDGSLTLQCEDARLRPVEQRFRRLLWQWEHCRCDMLMPDFCPVGNYHMGSIGVEVQENTLAADAGNNIVSHQYADQFEDAAAIAKLHDIEIFWDREADARDIEWLGSLFGDLLPVRFQGVRYIYYAPWDVFSSWRGMQNALCDLIDDPQKVHALYRRYQDIHLRLLRRMARGVRSEAPAKPYYKTVLGVFALVMLLLCAGVVISALLNRPGVVREAVPDAQVDVYGDTVRGLLN